MRRIEAITELSRKLTDELVIASTGMISRELYTVRDRPENFYMVGSMGCALPIGLGLALTSERKVIVIDGDGSALMGFASLAFSNALKLENFRHVILDNGSYASTGGQPTCSNAVDFAAIGHHVELIKVEPGNEVTIARIGLSPMEILSRFRNCIIP